MKTLHVDTGRTMQGGQWQVLYLLEQLADAVLLAPAKSALLAEANNRGMEARPLSIAALAQESRKADLVHAHDARAHMLASVACHKPMTVSRRVAFPIGAGALSRWKYGRADRYLAVSQFVRECLEKAGVQSGKIRVIYDGVPIPAAAAAPAAGRIVALASKGADLIRRAADLARVEVQFTTRLWEDLRGAAMFLYVSELEGLGSATIAAQASGVPVIASRVGGLPEAIVEGRTGLLISNQPEELAAAILRLKNDPAEAAEMGARARERAIEQFSAEIMARQTMQVYEEVVG